MTDASWARAEELFLAALDRPEAERRAWVVEHCGGETALAREVLELLEADRDEDFVLDRQAFRAPRSDPMIGQTVGAYRIEQLLGEGGMGVVYRACRDDDRYRAEVAIKFARRSSATPELLRRFESECRTLALLQHPNVARLLDAGATEEGLPYLVMELIEGRPLHEAANADRLDLRQRLRLFAEVCRAVHFAHQNLVVHRDIKPHNILIDAQGRPKLLDFGIAKVLSTEPDLAAPATATIHRAMTPEYASPEQLRGELVTTATDVYSLGVVLYELLVDCSPYDASSRSLRDMEIAVCEKPPRRPSTRIRETASRPERDWEEIAGRRGLSHQRLRRLLRGDLDAITMTALRKEPERRYASAERLAEDIERHLEGLPVSAQPDSVLYLSRKLLSRHRGKVGVLGFILALLIGSSVVATKLARDAASGWQQAEEEARHAQIETTSFQEMASFLTEALMASSELGALDDELIVEQLELQAELVRNKYAGRGHLQANLLDGLGRVSMRLGHRQRAGELIDEGMRIREQEFGRRSLEVALSLESQALLALEEGREIDAERALRERLDLHRRCEQGVHTDVAAAANDLAVVLNRLGRAEAAEELHGEALELRRRISGPRSSVVAESLNNLAGILQDRADLEGAEALLHEALDIRRDQLGRSHPLSLQSLANWATCLHRMGQIERAEAAYSEAIEGFRELRAAGRVALAKTLSSHALLLLAQGAVPQAETELREALRIHRSRGTGHPPPVTLVLKLAQVLSSRGAHEEVHELLDGAQRSLDEDAGSHPRHRGLILQQRGSTLLQQGDAERAMEALMDALDVLEEHAADRVEQVELARATLGLCFAALGDDEAAEECLAQAEAALSAVLPPEAGSLRQVRDRRRQLRDRREAGDPTEGDGFP